MTINKKTIYIRIQDPDGNSLGIVKTNISEEEFEQCVLNAQDIDSLIAYCKNKHPDQLCERFFINREMKLKT
jgi:hypothetical protein